LIIAIAALAVILLTDGVMHVLMAQNPFGGPRPGAAEPQVAAIVGWILARQSEFYREISSTIRAAKSDGSAVWTLLAISFALRDFSRRRPRSRQGGDLVLSRGQTRKPRGAASCCRLPRRCCRRWSRWCWSASAPGSLTPPRKTMCGAEKAIEIASYALIAAFGGWSGPRRRLYDRALRRRAPNPRLP